MNSSDAKARVRDFWDQAACGERLYLKVEIATPLTHGDLLTSRAGQQHRGAALAVAKRVWPRWFIRRFLPAHGLFMKITLEK